MDNKKFLRMFCPAFWPTTEDINDIEEFANKLELKTIIHDFRTKDNTLSLWNLDDPIDAALGLVNPNYKLSDVFFVKITESRLEEAGLLIKNNKGNSLFEDLNDNHFDILDVNYTSLKKVSELVLEAIKNEQYEFVISQEIIDRIKEYLDDGKIDFNILPKEIRNKISIPVG